MSSLQNAKLTKWQVSNSWVEKMPILWNAKLAKCQVNKIPS
jgi:hypothetical protein